LDADHSGNGHCLEVTEQKNRGTGDVGSCIGMTKSTGNSTAQQGATGDNGSDPPDDLLVYRLAIV